jgi:hypothetical protein
MKKKFDWGILLLIAVYLVFGAAILIAFTPMQQQQQDFPAEATIRASFDQHFEAFDQVSLALWEHPEYFDDLYEKTEVRALMPNTQDALEEGNEAGYLPEAAWNQLKTLCEIVHPYEIALRSRGGVNAVQWFFTVEDATQGEYALILYYIHALDASAPEKEQAAINDAISYLGRYTPLSPMEGKAFWYESVTSPDSDVAAPMPAPPKDE